MKTDPANATRWKHKFGFHNRGVQWDTPMSKWAGEGKDWIQLMAQGPGCKDEVTFQMLTMMRQPAEKDTQKGEGEGFLKEKARKLDLLVLDAPAEDKH